MSYRCPKIIVLAALLPLGACGSLLYQPQLLTGGINSNFPDLAPSYSADGQYLAFASDRRGQRDIFLFDRAARRLVDLPGLNQRESSQDEPSLSQDGRFLAYLSDQRGRPDIYIYDRQNQRATLMTANVRGLVARPSISGDGRSLIFQTTENGQWHIAELSWSPP